MTAQSAWRWLRDPWHFVFVVAGVLLLARNLYGLAASPPGMYVDEASIGYNAWSIAHYGVDEHGHPWPLFFQAFGEYKNPVYIYLLVPFVRVLGLTPAVVRTPAALLGLLTCAAVTATIWHLTKSKPLAFIALLICAFTPWLTQESRLGFEVISMVAFTAAGVYCVLRAGQGGRWWFAAAGVAFAVAAFGYTSGRVEEVALAVVAAACYGLARRRGWWMTLVPVAAAVLILLLWNQAHPGALTSRFNLISITAGGRSPGEIVSAFIGNYEAQLGFPFLFTHGDANLRHNTGFGGELLVVTAPLLFWGLFYCVWRWRRPFYAFCVAGFFAAPAAAAVTSDGIPHSLRAATMIPFAVVLTVIGFQQLLAFTSGRQTEIVAMGFGALIAFEGIAYLNDQFADYPARAAVWFDTGIPQAIQAAQADAGGHTVILSSNIDQAYIEAFMVDPPPPPKVTTADDDHSAGLVYLHMQVEESFSGSRPGDLLVLGPGETAPPGSSRLYAQTASDGSVLAQVVRIGQ
jgi:4-amino-4-deoxy-L-arabinose transferase-like glycosyltransferase